LTGADRGARLVRAVEATVSGDSSAVSELFTEDVDAWSPVVHVTSREALAVELEDMDDAFSELECHVRLVAVEQGHGCAEWVASAIHSGPYPVDERTVLEPTGRRVTLRGVSVAEFEGDRIRAFRLYWDEVDLVEGLGLLPDH
jgi:ketosteroid isomerase-like protein